MIAGLDTLRVAKDLEAASFTASQTEALARVLRERQEADLSQLATKADLDQLRAATKADLTLLRTELVQLEQRLTIKLGGMLALAVGVTTALVKLL